MTCNDPASPRLNPSHPDPSGAQLSVLREALQRIVEGKLKAFGRHSWFSVWRSGVWAPHVDPSWIFSPTGAKPSRLVRFLSSKYWWVGMWTSQQIPNRWTVGDPRVWGCKPGAPEKKKQPNPAIELGIEARTHKQAIFGWYVSRKL